MFIQIEFAECVCVCVGVLFIQAMFMSLFPYVCVCVVLNHFLPGPNDGRVAYNVINAPLHTMPTFRSRKASACAHQMS